MESLGELERTADRIVVLDAGRLLRASDTSDLTRTTGTVVVEVLGAPGSDRTFGQALVEAGLSAWPSGDKVEVRIDGPADLDLGLVRIQERRHTLDEVFLAPAAPHPSVPHGPGGLPS